MVKYALVIGIDRYENFSNLKSAAKDAEAIAQVLEQHGYVVTRLPRKLVRENQWAIDPDAKLKNAALSQELKTFLQERATRQEAIVYFAGHGFRVTDPLTDEAMGYLAASDATKDGQNAIRFDGFNTLLGKAELSSLVLLLDCCYAGSALEQQSLLQPTQKTISQKQNYCLIAACRDFERAREGKEHGIFTAAVLDGLSIEQAVNGEVTSNDLFGFVSRQLQPSGQEVTHAGMGRAIPILSYSSQNMDRSNITIDETCPYQGLKSFDETTAKFFFGRERIVQLLMEKLEQSKFIPVIGASGSGKSSVVRAGVIPKLRRNGWKILNIIQPGVEPIAKLKGTLEQFFRDQEKLSIFRQLYPQIEMEGLRPILEYLPDTPTLLVVDQFEEVFTVCSKEEEQEKFIDWLTQVADVSSPLTVLIILRIDFLEPCLHYRNLAQLIQDWQVLMLPLNSSELREVIINPAEKQGYRLGEGLLDLILEDVRREKNCLPLLEFALTELWKPATEEGHLLTLTQYQQMGRVAGALNLHSESLYKHLTLQEREWAKRIFLKLVRTGEGEQDTRQRRAKQYLLDMAENNETKQVVERVLQVMIDGRLLVADREQFKEGKDFGGKETVVDLTHEALMESWQRFLDWRKENRELRRLIGRVENAYREWIENSQSKEFLLMGGLLNLVQKQWHILKPELNIAIHRFYNTSLEYEQEQRLAQEMWEIQLKNNEGQLGGDYKEVSVLFSDIWDFISITENLEANESVVLLNEYFSYINDAILKHKGVIDKFIVSALMAVYNSSYLVEDHAWMAVQAAVEMQHRLQEFNVLKSEQQRLKIGVGISTGRVISGNIGSPKRMEFTVIGRPVSISSALERSTRLYGCKILISETTFSLCCERIWAREVDRIRLKGENEPINIYEVIGLRSDGISNELLRTLELHQEGREFYLNRKFTRAMAAFGEILEEINSNDKVAALHLKRCNHWLSYPPTDEDWDNGVYTLIER